MTDNGVSQSISSMCWHYNDRECLKCLAQQVPLYSAMSSSACTRAVCLSDIKLWGSVSRAVIDMQEREGRSGNSARRRRLQCARARARTGEWSDRQVTVLRAKCRQCHHIACKIILLTTLVSTSCGCGWAKPQLLTFKSIITQGDHARLST